MAKYLNVFFWEMIDCFCDTWGWSLHDDALITDTTHEFNLELIRQGSAAIIVRV